MSNRDMVLQLLNKIPDYKLGYILAYIQGITAEDSLDDQYCQALVDDYLADTDPEKHDTISLDEFLDQEGISL
jgi:hypothetical protein